MKKKTLWSVAVLVVVLLGAWAAFGRGDDTANIRTAAVERQDVERTVLATGQVVSAVDLELSFQASGVVREVLVREGQAVGRGQILAALDREQARANLTIAQGGLAEAQANYDRVLAGAIGEDIEVSRAAVVAAETTLENAYSAMLNSGLTATPAVGNSSDGTVTVSGTYTGTQTGEYHISIEGQDYRLGGAGIGESFGVQFADIKRGAPLPLGTRGLYLTFSSSGDFVTGDRWFVRIPNTQASAYLANLNAYEAAKKNLDQAKAALALKQAAARPEDLQAARAHVISAEGRVASAQAAYNDTIIRAPTGGTITQVDIRVGEQASALQSVMILQDVGDLHVEANVSEADIAALGVDQEVDYTFDALGPDRHVKGRIETINPASTVVSGIVNYKVTASIEDTSDIKPGMTANMTVRSDRRTDVLAVPSTAVLNRSGGKYVRVIDDPEKKTYQEVEVTTGLNADGGLVEIISGLNEGQEVVIDLQP